MHPSEAWGLASAQDSEGIQRASRANEDGVCPLLRPVASSQCNSSQDSAGGDLAMVQRPLTQRSPHTQAPTSQSCPDWPPHPSVLQSLQAPTDGRRKLGWVRQGAQSQVRTGTGQLPPHAPAEPRPPASALWAPGSTRGLLSSKANKALAQKDPEHTAPPHLAWPGPSKEGHAPKGLPKPMPQGPARQAKRPSGSGKQSPQCQTQCGARAARPASTDSHHTLSRDTAFPKGRSRARPAPPLALLIQSGQGRGT